MKLENYNNILLSLGIVTISLISYRYYKCDGDIYKMIPWLKKKINPLPQSQEELIDLLHYQKKMVLNNNIIKTLKLIDRKLFLEENEKNPYYDEPKSIGYNATISAPHMHSVMLDYLSEYIPKSNGIALDIGSGSGYISACLAQLMGPTGKVIGVEHIPELVERSKQSISKLKNGKELLERIDFKIGDGIKGYKLFHGDDDENGNNNNNNNNTIIKYDVIYLGAAIESLKESSDLIEQLKNGGRMIMPVGKSNDFHELMIVDKDQNGKVSFKSCGVVRFVPLVKSKEIQLQSHKTPNQTKIHEVNGEKVLIRAQIIPAPDSIDSIKQFENFYNQQQQQLQQNNNLPKKFSYKINE